VLRPSIETTQPSGGQFSAAVDNRDDCGQLDHPQACRTGGGQPVMICMAAFDLKGATRRCAMASGQCRGVFAHRRTPPESAESALVAGSAMAWKELRSASPVRSGRAHLAWRR
jgi:hypothetical protein